MNIFIRTGYRLDILIIKYINIKQNSLFANYCHVVLTVH